MEPGPSVARSTSLTGSSPRALGRAQAFANADSARIAQLETELAAEKAEKDAELVALAEKEAALAEKEAELAEKEVELAKLRGTSAAEPAIKLRDEVTKELAKISAMSPGPSRPRSASLTGSTPRALGRAQAFANAMGEPAEPTPEHALRPANDDDTAALAEAHAISERKSGDPSGLSTLMSCLLYTSPSPRDGLLSRMPSSA